MKKYIAQIETENYDIQLGDGGTIDLDGAPRDARLESIDDEALYSLLLDNKSYEVFVQESGGAYLINVNGQQFTVKVGSEYQMRAAGQPAIQTTQAADALAGPSHQGAPGAVTSPMTGVLLEILKDEGEEVETGEGVAILEAMKTENLIRAHRSGVVKNIQAVPGQTLRMDEVILEIDVPED